VTILNRSLVWDGKDLRYRADPKHAKELRKILGVAEGEKGLTMPCVKEGVDSVKMLPWGEGRGLDEELGKRESALYRRAAAIVNYLGPDRVDIQYAGKEVCRGMAKPTVEGWIKLRRLARYTLVAAEVEVRFGSEGVNEEVVRVFTDSDWAGCRSTRKSTSGGLVLFGGGVIKNWSSTQASVALSVGEAEFYAGIKGAAEGIGCCNLLRDLGMEVRVMLWTDSNTAKSMSSRTGMGKTRHIDTRYYWIQEVVRKGVVRIMKVEGEKNPSDILTKPQSLQEIIRRCGLVGINVIQAEVDIEAKMEGS
jgi:hypothetical protein